MFVSDAPNSRHLAPESTVFEPARSVRGAAPLASALLFFALLMLLVGVWAWRACDGIWTYALDDAYIHLAIAHNLGWHGVWGVSKTGFASSSSSPLWTILLAGVLRVWNSDLAPLVLNGLWSVAVLVLTARLWRGAWGAKSFSARAQTVGLLVLVVVVPLPLLVLVGMEHAMHAFLSLAFLGAASQSLGENRSARALPWLALLMGAARFEGVFLAGWAALALAKQKRFGAAAATFGAALFPFLLHGLMARTQGWPFVAASVAIKNRPPEHSFAGAMEFAGGIVIKWLLVWGCTAMALLALGLARRQRLAPAHRSALGLFGGATLAHVALALTGSFFRYEAYLFALGVAVLWPALVLAFPRERVWKTMPLQLATLFVVAAWGMRACSGLSSAAPGTRNIWRQQRQMARFVGEFYPRESVAFNDIGAVDWLAANRTDGRAALDLFGLSERETLRARLRDPHLVLWPREAQRIVKARGVRLAIIYDSWFEPHLLGPNWTRVARWDSGPVVTSDNRRVSFWTIKTNAPRLRAQLREFESQLPQGVEVLWE